MKYEILRLDGRYTYRDLFSYCIKFSNRMSVGKGPEQFNQAQKWFFDTYGWSAEIRNYDEIRKWYTKSVPIMAVKGRWATPQTDLPETCNPHWSWTNGYEDLRIYVKSDAELNFFQLKWPNEKNSV